MQALVMKLLQTLCQLNLSEDKLEWNTEHGQQ